METIKRTPRPQGVTYLAIQHQLSGDNEREATYNKLLSHIITLYTLDGFRYQGETVSIPGLAYILNVPQDTIMRHIAEIGTNMGSLANPDALQDTIKSLATLSMSFAMQDRGLIQNQLELTLRAQGPGYKPFISSEVNKNLKLLLESNKGLQEVYKTFFTSTNPTTNILNIYGEEGEQGKSDKDLLTTTEALDLIHNKGQANQLRASSKDTLPSDGEGGATGTDGGDASRPAVIPNPTSKSGTFQMAGELWDKHGIANLVDVKERRTGTEALTALGPDGMPTLSPEAPEPEGSHTNALKRRGYDIVDTDSLPA